MPLACQSKHSSLPSTQDHPSKIADTWRFEIHTKHLAKREFRTCVAFGVAKSWALTAAHCLPHQDPTSLHATILTGNDQEKRFPWPLRRIVLHPKFDLALVEHDFESVPNRIQLATVFPRSPNTDEVLNLETETSIPPLPMLVTEHHPPVTLARNDTGCIRPGDSGSPLWTAESPPQWAGILIRGAPTCTGQQVFVPVNQPLVEWINDELARASSSNHPQIKVR